MHAIQFTKHYKITAPSTYNDLTLSQLLAICKLKAEKVPVDQFLLRAAMILFNVKGNLRRMWHWKYSLNEDDVDALMMQSEFLLDHDQLTQNKLPVYKNMCGPKNWGHLGFMEWVNAERYYIDFVESQNQLPLDKLMATLYRPKDHAANKDPKFTGDIRQPYNEEQLDAIMYETHVWPDEIKLAIVLFYEGMRSHILQQMGAIGTTTKKKGKKVNFAMRMLETMHAFTGNDLTKFDTIKQMKMPLIILQMRRNAQINEELKQHHSSRK